MSLSFYQDILKEVDMIIFNLVNLIYFRPGNIPTDRKYSTLFLTVRILFKS
jgi:hypothetical protein